MDLFYTYSASLHEAHERLSNVSCSGVAFSQDIPDQQTVNDGFYHFPWLPGEGEGAIMVCNPLAVTPDQCFARGRFIRPNRPASPGRQNTGPCQSGVERGERASLSGSL